MEQMIPPSVRAAILRQVALFLIGRIKRRTKQGLDVEGKPFKAYSAAYADQRKRSGWQTTPDLWLQGGMLNGMVLLESTDRRALIGFSGSAPAVQFAKRARARTHKKTGEKVTHTFRPSASRQVANAIKAYAHNTGDHVPRRHFFGLSAEDKVEGTKLALRLMREYIARSSLNRAARRR